MTEASTPSDWKQASTFRKAAQVVIKMNREVLEKLKDK